MATSCAAVQLCRLCSCAGTITWLFFPSFVARRAASLWDLVAGDHQAVTKQKNHGVPRGKTWNVEAKRCAPPETEEDKKESGPWLDWLGTPGSADQARFSMLCEPPEQCAAKGGRACGNERKHFGPRRRQLGSWAWPKLNCWSKSRGAAVLSELGHGN